MRENIDNLLKIKSRGKKKKKMPDIVNYETAILCIRSREFNLFRQGLLAFVFEFA